MIVSKTPLRMSFVGGGSDIPAFYKESEGAVVSTAINKYMYITVGKKFTGNIRISYSRTEQVNDIKEIKHPLVKESLSLLKIEGGIEITSTADIPSQGSGLGSSSSYTVGLLNALYAFNQKKISTYELAEAACKIEIEKCKEPIGKQDQYAAAFGGLNFIRFKNDGVVIVEPINCKAETIKKLEESVLVFYTGRTRSASDLLRQQSKNIKDSNNKRQLMNQMVKKAHNVKKCIENDNLDEVGSLLHENWMLKKEITKGVSDQQIDTWYNKAINAGAHGGKLMGAGHGGFFMFLAEKNNHRNIIRELSDLKYTNILFDTKGSRIVFNDENNS